MKTNLKKFAGFISGVILISSVVACSEKKAGTVDIAIQMGSYTTAQNKPVIWKLLGFNESHAAVSSLQMCFKRLRFKLAEDNSVSNSSDDDSDTDFEDNIDLEIGEIDINADGALLGVVNIPEGEYRRIEFDLEPECGSGKSIQLANSNGTFSSNQRIKIRFEGSFTADTDGVLILGVQQILNALNSFNGGDLKSTAESVSGVLSN